jgi:hypothetical protein
MPSIGTRIVQPLNRHIVVSADANGAYFYRESDLDTWLAANPGLIVKRDGSFYSIPGKASGTTFEDVLYNNGNPSPGNPPALQHTLGNITDRKTLVDLRHQIYIGDGVSTDLLVFRKVQEYSDTDGGGRVGYVVVQNNRLSLGGNAGRFTVRVALI